jgi:transcriptional regulator with XRE-family HTH domain
MLEFTPSGLATEIIEGAIVLPMAQRHPRTGDDSPNRIRVLREAKGLTQTQLGEMIGLSQDAIGKIERGDRNLKANQIKAIARALGCRPGALLHPEEDDGGGEVFEEPLDRVLMLEAVRQIHPFLDKAILADPAELAGAILDVYDQLLERARAQRRIERRPIRVKIGGDLVELKRRHRAA